VVDFGKRLPTPDHEGADDAVRPEQRNNQQRAITCPQDEVSYGGGRLAAEVGHLYGLATLGGGADVRFARADLLLPDRLDELAAHPVRRA
jgi:hypothetical protein